MKDLEERLANVEKLVLSQEQNTYSVRLAKQMTLFCVPNKKKCILFGSKSALPNKYKNEMFNVTVTQPKSRS